MVGREERKYHTTAENKPPYKCKGCGGHVMPPKKEKLHGPLSTEERKAREAKGHDISEHPEGGVAIHPPRMVSAEGKPIKLDHGDVTSEMLPARSRTGKQMQGVCPGCHAAGQRKVIASATGKTPEEAKANLEAQATKKALDLLDDMLMIKSSEDHPEPLEKGVRLVLAL
jgi:hypothetical protein